VICGDLLIFKEQKNISMIAVGLIGEHPTDVDSIIVLLKQKFTDKFHFFPLLFDINGSALDNPKFKHQLRREYQVEQPNIVIFIRDLDAPRTDNIQLQKRKEYFANFNSVVDKKGVLLLHIQELEAILLSDVAVLNKYFNATLESVNNCEDIPNPKDEIKRQIPNYSTGLNQELFKLYSYENIVNNCNFFKEFNTSFTAMIT
jgi:hypothetical protein